MTAEFLGVGWKFPVAVSASGQIEPSYYEDNIREAIWLILNTAKGERVMRPEFGCGIHDLVFAVNDATTAGTVAEQVRKALVIWEPRIELLDVSATQPSGQANTLLIHIVYRTRTTNTVFNLVYPFYLERSAS